MLKQKLNAMETHELESYQRILKMSLKCLQSAEDRRMNEQHLIAVNLLLAERELQNPAVRLRDLQIGSIFRFSENGVRWVVIHAENQLCNQRPIFQIMSENCAFRTTFKVDRGVKPLAVVPHHVQLWSWRQWHDKQQKQA